MDINTDTDLFVIKETVLFNVWYRADGLRCYIPREPREPFAIPLHGDTLPFGITLPSLYVGDGRLFLVIGHGIDGNIVGFYDVPDPGCARGQLTNLPTSHSAGSLYFESDNSDNEAASDNESDDDVDFWPASDSEDESGYDTEDGVVVDVEDDAWGLDIYSLISSKPGYTVVFLRSGKNMSLAGDFVFYRLILRDPNGKVLMMEFKLGYAYSTIDVASATYACHYV